MITKIIKKCILFTLLLSLALTVMPINANAASLESVNSLINLKSANDLGTKEYWRSLGGHFYYDRLSAKQKELYNKIMDLNLDFITSEKDIKTSFANINCAIPIGSLPGSTAENVLACFKSDNGQFYFLKFGEVEYINGENYLIMSYLSGYKKGNNRAYYTRIAKQRFDYYLSAVNDNASEYEKISQTVDVITSVLKYGKGDKSGYYDDHDITSALFTNKTVCVGYSELTNVILHAKGITSIIAVNDTHQWNKVKIGQTWYNLEPQRKLSSSTGNLQSDAAFWKKTDQGPACLYNYSPGKQDPPSEKIPNFNYDDGKPKEATTYTIKFNANGGTGKMSTIKATYGENVKLTKNTFKKNGYKFKGWATTKSNAKAKKIQYKNKATVKNLTAKDKGSVTLYAVWSK